MLDAAASFGAPRAAPEHAAQHSVSSGFLFAAGIDTSAPRVAGGHRRDQLKECDFFERWREDFALARDVGCRALGYGPQLHATLRGDGRHDWAFADETFAELRRLGVAPIADLCRFGVPDWIGDFQNTDFPELFARYAGAFARRFPWVRLYTPVHGMSLAAALSAKHGCWNERRSDDRGHVTAIRNLARANALAMRAILEVRPDAVFVLNEAIEHSHAEGPAGRAMAERSNAERFLALDLLLGRGACRAMEEFVLDNGLSREDRAFFLRGQDLRRRCVLGTEWRPTAERAVGADGRARLSGEILGYDTVARAYFGRYGLPLMHAGAGPDQGPAGDEAERWLARQWDASARLRRSGVPVIGFAWSQLTDGKDWDSALTEVRGRTNPRGLFDLERRIRPVGRAYRRLVGEQAAALRPIGGGGGRAAPARAAA